MNEHDMRPVVAVCKRFGHVAFVVLCAKSTWEVVVKRTRNRPAGQSIAQLVSDTALRLANEYAAAAIITEARSDIESYFSNEDRPMLPVAFEQAHELLWPSQANLQLEECFLLLLEKHGELSRFVTILPTGRIAMSERDKTLILRTVILGLAGHKQRQSTTSCTNDYESH